MTFSLRQLSIRTRLGSLTLAPILLLLVMVIFFPPDGTERSQSLQFIGRFHLPLIHFPIAFVVLVAILQLAARKLSTSDHRLLIDFLAGLASVSASLAAILGWSLAWSGGYSGSLVTQHMWAGISVAVGAWLIWAARLFDVEKAKSLYGMMLASVVGLVLFTGYRGGQLAQGENHLTEYMPARLRAVLGLTRMPELVATTSSPATFYGAYIQPIFAAHCVSCHGPNKHRAGLRLDSYEGLMHGASCGHVIRAGDPKGSELFERVTLPSDDDDYMPADKKLPLSSSEVKLINLWIAAGALATMPANAIKDLPSPVTAVAEVTFEEIDPAKVARERTPLADLVRQLQQRFPNILGYESRSSADLIINASLWGRNFGDQEMAEFAPLREHIVAADFSNTAISDRSAALLAQMQHLRSLRLMHDKVTDATIQALGSLHELESLNLFDTPVTAAALRSIAGLPKLRTVYVDGTKISADRSIPEQLKGKVSF